MGGIVLLPTEFTSKICLNVLINSSYLSEMNAALAFEYIRLCTKYIKLNSSYFRSNEHNIRGIKALAAEYFLQNSKSSVSFKLAAAWQNGFFYREVSVFTSSLKLMQNGKCWNVSIAMERPMSAWKEQACRKGGPD